MLHCDPFTSDVNRYIDSQVTRAVRFVKTMVKEVWVNFYGGLLRRPHLGLGGSLWTQDVQRGEGLVRRIESGAVFVNGMTVSDPCLPFGGIKRSGYGRELCHFGIREFVNIKSIWIK